MTIFQAVTPVRLYRRIADQIAGCIQRGDFVIGARLPAERDLAEQLQVSRASVREALIALEIEGYVDVRVGSGVFVCAPPPRQASVARHPEGVHTHANINTNTNDISPFELLEARLLLEPECAALATQKASPEQLDAIAATCAALPTAVTDMPLQYDIAFHAAIAAACGNAALASAIAHLRMLSDVNPVFSRLNQHMVTDAVWVLAHQEHERIVAAMRARDSTRARHAMRDHLLSVQARLREDFDA